MAPPTDRQEILAAFRKQIESGTAIVGAGAGMSTPKEISCLPPRLRAKP